MARQAIHEALDRMLEGVAPSVPARNTGREELGALPTSLRYADIDSPVVQVLREGGSLPELRRLGLGDEALLAALRRLHESGVVDEAGQLVQTAVTVAVEA